MAPAADGRGVTDTLLPAGGHTGRTRAVVRFVEPGSMVDCATCGATVKFAARTKVRQVICNVYEGGRWARVEHHHEECYERAGSPHGPADASQPMRVRRRAGG